FYFGQRVSEDWAWFGKFETFKFTDVNYDKIKIKSTVKLSKGEQDFYFNLPNLKMELDIIGLTAQAAYTFLRWKFIETDLTFGFSLYSWKFNRSKYVDTLRVDTGSGKVDAVRLNVPAITQEDLSGGFNFGIDLNIHLENNLWLNIGGSYKAIIGELWYTQALGLDRVSTFQMLEARAGFKVKL
ncbi:MAG: hypothetical protein N3A61_09240, partial [Ignavibacteria bacterium]|nr:hypothetical protein [Ignavibacteria bacterium]